MPINANSSTFSVNALGSERLELEPDLTCVITLRIKPDRRQRSMAWAESLERRLSPRTYSVSVAPDAEPFGQSLDRYWRTSAPE